MKQTIKRIWNKRVITIDDDEFTLGECAMVWGGLIAFIVLLNAVA